MLKRTIGFLLIIALIQSVMPTPVAHTASADIIISHIQPGVTGGATKEYVALFNNGDIEVEVTNWCLKNKSDTAFACFAPEQQGEQFWLPAGAFAVIHSLAYRDSLPMGMTSSLTYTPANQSSGGLVGSSDTVTLVDSGGAVVDQYTWRTSLSGGAIFMRETASAQPLLYAKDSWSSGLLAAPIPSDEIERRIVELLDVCDNLEGIQADDDPLIVLGEEGVCTVLDPPIITLHLHEILPNPAGADSGKEFIELYNYGTMPVYLDDMYIQYGSRAEKRVALVNGVVEAGQYFVLRDVDIGFVLTNTSGIVQLMTGNSTIIDETSYSNAKDDQSWSWFLDGWRYSKEPTPGERNIDTTIVAPTVPAVLVPKACAANQYRHPETGRCRLTAVSTVTPAPCKSNQTRNPGTGRCRNVVASTNPVPCKPGQERNAETNRCRTIRTLAATNYDILETDTKTSVDQWYVYAAIAGVLSVLLGYAAWEWRVECKRLLMRLRWSVIRR